MSQPRESVWWERVLFAAWLVFAITGWAQTTVLQPGILLTVTKGAGPTELSSSDIDLKEDGRTPHTVSVVKWRNLPLRVGIVIDESGSGRRAGLHSVIIQRTLDSAADWLQAHGGDGFLVGFNDQIIISTELVTDVGHLRNVMGQLRPIGGSERPRSAKVFGFTPLAFHHPRQRQADVCWRISQGTPAGTHSSP